MLINFMLYGILLRDIYLFNVVHLPDSMPELQNVYFMKSVVWIMCTVTNLRMQMNHDGSLYG